MKITVLGVTGGTGKSLMNQALDAGHEVTAVARRPEAIERQSPHLRVAKGDVFDAESLIEPVTGADVVISCVGIAGLMQARKGTTLYSAGTSSVLRAMEKTGTRRLIVVSSGGVEPQPSDGWFYLYILKPFFLEKMYDDMRIMEQAVRDSKVDWVIVRPPYLTNKALDTSYRLKTDGPFADDRDLSRDSLAHFLLAEAVQDKLRHQVVRITS